MSPTITFLMFFIIATTVIVGWHGYLWLRLVRATRLTGRHRTMATLALITLGAAIPLTLVVARTFPFSYVRPFAFVGFEWIGIGFVVFTILLASDLVRGLRALSSMLARRVRPSPKEATSSNMEDRVRSARNIAKLALLGGILAALWGSYEALGAVPTVTVQVPLQRLPEQLSGTRIVMLSDLHVGALLRRSFVEQVVASVNDLKPDLVVIVGDLVDGSVAELGSEVAPLGNLKSTYGTFFVTGNHEYYSGVNPWIEELTRLGIRVLRNERVEIGSREHSFDLAGVDDWTASRHGEGHGHDLTKALANLDPAREVVLLAHQPISIRQAAKQGVGLQLSGHTHGGQIFPWNYLVLLQQPFVAGLYRVSDTWLYVGRGTGFWGPPMRVGAPPEITEIVLLRSPLSNGSR